METKLTMFQFYMLDWYNRYINTHDESVIKRIAATMHEDTDYHICDTPSPELIYKIFFGYSAKLKELPDVPKAEEFVAELLNKAPKPCVTKTWADEGKVHEEKRVLSFVQDFIDDMAYHASDYDHPADYFDDLNYGGCISGTVASLIYTSDCEKIYEKNKADLEDYVGCCGRYKELGNRATQVCWNAYERMGSRIAEYLFPDKTRNFRLRLNQI